MKDMFVNGILSKIKASINLLIVNAYPTLSIIITEYGNGSYFAAIRSWNLILIGLASIIVRPMYKQAWYMLSELENKFSSKYISWY